MRISIFTPSHDTQFLQEAYDSLKDQDFFEWIVILNNGAKPIDFNDARVKMTDVGNVPPWVGPLKKIACQKATGDILLELDHDDLLMPNAVSEVRRAFRKKDVGFVYSNTIHATRDFQRTERFSEEFGWKYREVFYKGGRVLDEHISFPPTPDSISRIWFAPNHLRAFRKKIYDEVGGYSPDMRILDDLDLMCRLYRHTNFRHIDQGLYIYRVHGANTWIRYNQEIQNNVYRIYDQYIEALVARWCDMNKLLKIEIGAGIDPTAGYTSVDRENATIIADLDQPWPFPENSVGVIRAHDILEHLDPIHAMKEIYRVLAPGGWLLSLTPSTDGRGAFQDPTHVSFWNENSFFYYTEERRARYIKTPVRFQAPRLYTTTKNDEQVCWVVAHLISLKNGYRPPGRVMI